MADEKESIGGKIRKGKGISDKKKLIEGRHAEIKIGDATIKIKPITSEDLREFIGKHEKGDAAFVGTFPGNEPSDPDKKDIIKKAIEEVSAGFRAAIRSAPIGIVFPLFIDIKQADGTTTRCKIHIGAIYQRKAV